MSKSQYLVLVGSQLTVSKGSYYFEGEAVREVADRLSGSRRGHVAGAATRYRDVRDIGRAWILTDELKAKYERLVHEASVEYRREAKASVKAQVAGQVVMFNQRQEAA